MFFVFQFFGVLEGANSKARRSFEIQRAFVCCYSVVVFTDFLYWETL